MKIIKTENGKTFLISKAFLADFLKNEEIKRKLINFLLSLKQKEFRLNWLTKRNLLQGKVPERVHFYARFIKKFPNFWRNLLRHSKKENSVEKK